MAKIEVKITDSKKINTLVRLIDKYKDSLPTELADHLKTISSGKEFCYSAKDINFMMARIDASKGRGYLDGELKVVADDNEVKHVTSVNTLLRTVNAMSFDDYDRVIINGGVFVCDTIEPKKMIMTYDDEILMSWS